MEPSCCDGDGDGDGEVATQRAVLSSDTSAGDGSEDRLSALPDDILVVILLRLDTKAAVQTSVLSHRWRRVWALLPELNFFFFSSDHRQIGPAIQAHEAAIRLLSVATRDAGPESVAAWLPVAAPRLCGALVFHNNLGRVEGDDGEEAGQRAAVELPCLEHATDVWLRGFIGLAVAPAGVFARLIQLRLDYVRLYSPGDLGDAVSWPRCPCLQKLSISDTKGLGNLTIHSNSLQKLQLAVLRGLQRLDIVAPALEELIVANCFFDSWHQPVASITAPQLAMLTWMDPYNPSSVHLGEMKHLRLLMPFFFSVYGHASFTLNQSCLSLLQRFKDIECLELSLAYLSDIDDYDYVMEDMTTLPDIKILHLNVLANGHAFGASAFHVLRMCSSIQKLILPFHSPPEADEQTTCGCTCSEHQNWKTEHLLLNHLKEVTVIQIRGSEREVTFLKHLFNWATSLEMMRVFFDVTVTESVAKELSQLLRSFARPGIHMEFHTYVDILKTKMIGFYRVDLLRPWQICEDDLFVVPED